MFEFSFHSASVYLFLVSKSAITLSDPGMWAQAIHTLNFVQYSQISFANSLHDLLLDDSILFITVTATVLSQKTVLVFQLVYIGAN